MRRVVPLLLVFLILLAGCSAASAPETTEPAGQMQIGNPWKTYSSLADAENACGLTYPIPENIPEGFTVESYCVMSSSLLEVTYINGDTEITVRMLSAENQDISGVYEDFTETETFTQGSAAVTKMMAADCCVYLVHKSGYSFSIYATSLTADDTCREILSYIC